MAPLTDRPRLASLNQALAEEEFVERAREKYTERRVNREDPPAIVRKEHASLTIRFDVAIDRLGNPPANFINNRQAFWVLRREFDQNLESSEKPPGWRVQGESAANLCHAIGVNYEVQIRLGRAQIGLDPIDEPGIAHMPRFPYLHSQWRVGLETWTAAAFRASVR